MMTIKLLQLIGKERRKGFFPGGIKEKDQTTDMKEDQTTNMIEDQTTKIKMIEEANPLQGFNALVTMDMVT